MIVLQKNYGKLIGGIPYNLQEEGRDWVRVNNHYVPKKLISEYRPEENEEKEYEDFV